MWLTLTGLNRNFRNTRGFSKRKAGYARNPKVQVYYEISMTRTSRI